MAQPIPLEIPARDPRQELLCRLQNAPMEHAEALLSAYDLLQRLHDAGALDLMRGALGAGDKIVEQAVELTNTPESIRAIRNTVVFAKVIGEMDPELLNAFLGAIPGALAEAKATEPPGFWRILNKFRSKDLRRGLAMVNAFLEGFGRNINRVKKSKENENEQA